MSWLAQVDVMNLPVSPHGFNVMFKLRSDSIGWIPGQRVDKEVAVVRRFCCRIGLVALLLGGCANPAEEMLNALRADDMASAQWEGIDQVAVQESDPHVIKPGQPHYIRCLATTMPTSEAMELISAYAEDSGWQPQDNLIADSSWVAHRVVNGTTRVLILTTDLVTCTDAAGAVLRLTLTY